MSTTEKITLDKIPSAQEAVKMSKKVSAQTEEYKAILAMIQDAINAGKTFIFKDRATLSSGIVACLEELGYEVNDGSEGWGYKVSWAKAEKTKN